MNINLNPIPENKNMNTIDAAALGSKGFSGASLSGVDISKKAETASVMGDAFVKNLQSATNTTTNYDNKTGLEEIESEAISAETTDLGNLKYMQETMTDVDYDKVRKDGFSLQKDEPGAIVTVVDKIKIQIAKGGGDISIFGDDISREAIEEYTGSAALANSVNEAMNKADELRSISDGDIACMVKEDLAPTINGFYSAQFSGSTAMPSIEIPEELTSSVENVIEASGLPNNEQSRKMAGFFLANDLPLTPEALKFAIDLKEVELPLDESVALDNILVGLSKGVEPGDEALISGYSIADKAKDVMHTIATADVSAVKLAYEQTGDVTIRSLSGAISTKSMEEAVDELKQMSIVQDVVDKAAMGMQSEAEPDETTAFLITKTRQLEEIRMTMTFEASYSLIKKGFPLETAPLKDVVEALRTEESWYYNRMLGNTVAEGKSVPEPVEATKLETQRTLAGIMFDTNRVIDGLRSAPAAIIAEEDTFTLSVNEVANRGAVRAEDYRRVGETYEALMTAPRADLGDSIKQAFRNVPEILSDLGLENSEMNARAVRILGYNSMEITTENIESVRYSDMKVQTMFDLMTPSTTLDLIREGVNPLDLTIDELIAKAEEVGRTHEQETNEKYSEFLYNLENKNAITQEEREAYMGIYRLINQVQFTDGAVIGALMEAGADLSMKNLISGVRTARHGHTDVRVDDNVSGIDGGYENSITGQIDSAFQKLCASAAGRIIDTQTAGELFDQGGFEDMTPQQLFERLKEIKASLSDEAKAETDKLAREYAKDQVRQLSAVMGSEEQIVEMLNRYDMPKNLYNMLAANQMINSRGKIFNQLFKAGEDDPDVQELIEETFKAFGEAVKTPEDMAKAQEKLGELAETVLKNDLERNDVKSVDIRNLRITSSAIRLGAKQAEDEYYNIPVMVETEAGTLSLKIVRGKKEYGSFFISMENSVFGKVAFEAKTSEKGISAIMAVADEAAAQDIERLRPSIIEALRSGIELQPAPEPVEGQSVELSVMVSKNLDTAAYIDNAPASVTDDEQSGTQRNVQTRTLYGAAKAVVGLLAPGER